MPSLSSPLFSLWLLLDDHRRKQYQLAECSLWAMNILKHWTSSSALTSCFHAKVSKHKEKGGSETEIADKLLPEWWLMSWTCVNFHLSLKMWSQKPAMETVRWECIWKGQAPAVRDQGWSGTPEKFSAYPPSGASITHCLLMHSELWSSFLLASH